MSQVGLHSSTVEDIERFSETYQFLTGIDVKDKIHSAIINAIKYMKTHWEDQKFNLIPSVQKSAFRYRIIQIIENKIEQIASEVEQKLADPDLSPENTLALASDAANNTFALTEIAKTLETLAKLDKPSDCFKIFDCLETIITPWKEKKSNSLYNVELFWETRNFVSTLLKNLDLNSFNKQAFILKLREDPANALDYTKKKESPNIHALLEGLNVNAKFPLFSFEDAQYILGSTEEELKRLVSTGDVGPAFRHRIKMTFSSAGLAAYIARDEGSLAILKDRCKKDSKDLRAACISAEALERAEEV